MVSSRLVTGLFNTRMAAENAIEVIIKGGYARGEISILMSDATKEKEFGSQSRIQASANAAEERNTIRGTAGAVALVTILAACRTRILRGIRIVMAEPMAASLELTGSRGNAGSLTSALIGAGIDEHRARFYHVGIRGGGILVGVGTKSGEDLQKLETLLRELGGQSILQD